MRSPHRERGDAGDCWRMVLLGEILRVLDGPARVRDEPDLRLPRSGRWETGLARVRPALDDALGATAFAVAWRWARAALNTDEARQAWPGAPSIARKATAGPVVAAPLAQLALVQAGAVPIAVEAAPAGPGGRTWTLRPEDGQPAVVSVSDCLDRDWTPVDRAADVVAAWVGGRWEAR